LRLALFGGTFDPVHCGHLKSAFSVKQEFALDRVLLIPSKSPVHKPGACASGDDRARMIELAAADYPGLELSRIEIDRDAPSFSVLTVRDISAAFPDAELFFMLGTDAFNTLCSWREYFRLMSMVTFIVLGRGGEEADREIVSRCRRVLFSNNERIDVSSTQIRESLCSDDSLDGILPDVVLRYIREKRLYAQLQS
jgi:nicotinate-nucleotide adenylyltransferase